MNALKSSNVISLDWLGIVTKVILFGLENVVSAGLICTRTVAVITFVACEQQNGQKIYIEN